MISIGLLVLGLHFHVSEIKCMTNNVYYESRGESIPGMIAVANVTLNRTLNEKFPNTVCEVVYQHKQFSWTYYPQNDRFDRKTWFKSLKISINSYIFREDNTNGSLFYHVKKVKPYWRKRFQRTKEIGNHVFYK